MRIAVIGAGALGCLLGGLLHRSGEAVSFVARGEALARLHERGVTVASPLGDLVTGPLPAWEDPAALGVADVVLVTVKAWQVEALAPSLRPLVGPDTVVIPTQNGVDAADQLAAALGDAVVGGVCHVLARLGDGPAVVTHSGPPPRLTLGERRGGISDRLRRLAPVFTGAGVEVKLTENVSGALWEKLLFVEPYGSVGAASRSPVEVVRSLPETRALLEAAMKEVAAVAAARGTPVREGAVERALGGLDALPAGAMSSLHRDLVAGRPSELACQTGAVVRLGREAGVPVPVHEVLWAVLWPQARSARS
jgi:2-dehydropantoate 2-reductase